VSIRLGACKSTSLRSLGLEFGPSKFSFRIGIRIFVNSNSEFGIWSHFCPIELVASSIFWKFSKKFGKSSPNLDEFQPTFATHSNSGQIDKQASLQNTHSNGQCHLQMAQNGLPSSGVAAKRFARGRAHFYYHFLFSFLLANSLASSLARPLEQLPARKVANFRSLQANLNNLEQFSTISNDLQQLATQTILGPLLSASREPRWANIFFSLWPFGATTS